MLSLHSTTTSPFPICADVGFQSDWLETLQMQFMQDAFIGGALTACVAAIIGYFVILRRDAFSSHAIAHIGFPGATGAILLGVPPLAGLVLFCTAGAVAIGTLGKQLEHRDVATGIILGLATALGVLFSSLAGAGQSALTNVLFGNLLAISRNQLLLFAAMTAVVVLVIAIIAKPLMFASVNPQVARARGVSTGALGIVFMVALAVATTMAVQVIGTLLLFALLIAPIATALMITARPLRAVGLAMAIGVASVCGGLALSAMFNLPPSFFIVAITSLGWFTATAATRLTRSSPNRAIRPDTHHPI